MRDLIIALDGPSQREALAFVDELGARGGFYKVGLELYTGAGPEVVRALKGRGKRVFLDLKLFDIPTTVAAAVRAAVDLGADLLTVHATGGADMLAAAAAAAEDGVRLLGVTLLTSFTPEALADTWARPVPSIEREVVRLARLAHEAGVRGFVSSVHEVAALRTALGPEPYLVAPGIRLPGGPPHDQARVATPAEAVMAGASALVVGRAVTAARDPAAALAEVARAVREASP
jgi:orotidine-5'-phosphate decarboxylase